MDGNVTNVDANREMSPREKGMLEFAQLDAYFRPYDDKFGRYAYAEKRIQELSNLAPAHWIRILIALILLIPGVMTMLCFIGELNLGFDGVMLILSLVFIVPAIMLIRSYVVENRAKKSGDIELAELKRELVDLSEELKTVYANYPGVCPVGEEYVFPDYRKLIGERIRQGRANNCLEAINVILDDFHKAKLEAGMWLMS